MKKIFLLLMMALFVACKTQSKVVPLVIRDSISITYKQGSPFISVESMPDGGKVLQEPRSGELARTAGQIASTQVGGVKSVESAESVRDILVRVDTVFVERWRTQYLPEPPKPIPRFYKDCTAGFWILLIVLIGGSALRISRQSTSKGRLPFFVGADSIFQNICK